MIVCTRPVVIYDADVIGAAVMLVLALGAIGAGAPLLASGDGHARQKAAVAAAKIERKSAFDEMDRISTQAKELSAMEARIRSSLVAASSMPETLTSIAGRAASLNVTLTQLAPQPPVAWDEFQMVEIRIIATGDALNLLRLLHGLHFDYRWLQIDAFELQAPLAGASTSTLGCTLRWFARQPTIHPAEKPA
ncbi:MAG: hypothetical protein JNG88_01935 [Phycisphaerales bacterium]|nr:hypothetical protein [Phycisphaerales bacterium]